MNALWNESSASQHASVLAKMNSSRSSSCSIYVVESSKHEPKPIPAHQSIRFSVAPSGADFHISPHLAVGCFLGSDIVEESGRVFCLEMSRIQAPADGSKN